MRFAITVFIMLALASRAKAQSDEMFALRISESDFRRMFERLPPDAPDAAAAAHGRFTADCAREADLIRARLKHPKRNETGDTWERITSDWWTKRNELEARLATDVAAVLGTDAQRAAWSRAVADDRRRYILHEIKIDQRARSPFDPMTALDALNLTEQQSARVAPAVEACVAAIDQALAAWQRAHIQFSRSLSEIPPDAPDGNQQRRTVVNEWQASLARVKAACDSGKTAIADALDLKHREAFLIGIDRQVYPEAFERCPAELFADALRFTPDIPPEKRAAIEAIYANYLPRRDLVRGQIIDVVRTCERSDHPINLGLKAAHDALERGEIDMEERNRRLEELLRTHPANPLLERRHNLAMDAVRSMRAMFGDDEIANLPVAARLALTAFSPP